MSSPGKILYDTSTTGVAPLSDRAIHHQTIAGHQRETYCMLRAQHMSSPGKILYIIDPAVLTSKSRNTQNSSSVSIRDILYCRRSNMRRDSSIDGKYCMSPGGPALRRSTNSSSRAPGKYCMSPGGPAFRRSTNSPTAPMSFFEAYCMIRLTTECSVAKPLSELIKEDRRPHTVCSDSIRVLLCQGHTKKKIIIFEYRSSERGCPGRPEVAGA